MPTILIIDDNPHNIHVLQTTLEAHGFDVYVELTGQDGYDTAVIQEPDLIITDLRMPKQTLDGYDTARKLRAHPDTAHIPIIALSAAGDPVKAEASGCNAFVQHPVNKGELLKILGQYLAIPR